MASTRRRGAPTATDSSSPRGSPVRPRVPREHDLGGWAHDRDPRADLTRDASATGNRRCAWRAVASGSRTASNAVATRPSRRPRAPPRRPQVAFGDAGGRAGDVGERLERFCSTNHLARPRPSARDQHAAGQCEQSWRARARGHRAARSTVAKSDGLHHRAGAHADAMVASRRSRPRRRWHCRRVRRDRSWRPRLRAVCRLVCRYQASIGRRRTSARLHPRRRLQRYPEVDLGPHDAFERQHQTLQLAVQALEPKPRLDHGDGDRADDEHDQIETRHTTPSKAEHGWTRTTVARLFR